MCAAIGAQLVEQGVSEEEVLDVSPPASVVADTTGGAGEALSGRHPRTGPLDESREALSEKRKYRSIGSRLRSARMGLGGRRAADRL